MKIAVAATKEGTIFDGHFAHAPVFKIFKYEGGGRMELVEERENPLGDVPDLDAGHHHHGHHGHGVAKYAWLREKVLPDVDAVIAAGACQTSHTYFTSQGVKMLYTDPVEVDLLLRYVKENPQEFEEVLSSH
ncbi:MAG: NifB/NifX family molybdenum-iron cluster-binding protein [Pyrobaculum sp.]